MLHSLQSKKSQVGFVKYSDSSVVKTPEEEVKAHPNVGNVWKRNQNSATRFEQCTHPLQNFLGVAKVLHPNLAAYECVVYRRHLLLGGPSDKTEGRQAVLVSAMESTLTRQLGPVARLLVRRAATAAHDETDLLKRLAVHLGSQEERDLFLANSGKLTAARAALEAAQTRTLPLGVAPVNLALTADSSGSQATVLATQAHRNNQTAAAESLSAAFLEQARECVARRVGPIAKIMVRKAAAQASGRAAFIEALCAQCDDAGDRAALARELRGL